LVVRVMLVICSEMTDPREAETCHDICYSTSVSFLLLSWCLGYGVLWSERV